MFIIKASGERVKFKPEKIRETLRRIGAKPEVIEHILTNTQKVIVDSMTTAEVFRIVRREIKKEDHCLSHRYNLRQGLLKLGPAGFNFEKYIASVLSAYQYKTEIPEKELSGLCVQHEIDVIASRDGKTIMIEAKFRNKFENTVTLKDAMATWARFLDLKDGAKTGKCPDFDEVWIMTNGRFSDRALQFGVCKGIRVIGWSSKEQSLVRMVDHAALYPITVLEYVRPWELDGFAKKNIMLCREIADQKPESVAKQTGIALDRAKKIVLDCKQVVDFQ